MPKYGFAFLDGPHEPGSFAEQIAGLADVLVYDLDALRDDEEPETIEAPVLFFILTVLRPADAKVADRPSSCLFKYREKQLEKFGKEAVKEKARSQLLTLCFEAPELVDKIEELMLS